MPATRGLLAILILGYLFTIVWIVEFEIWIAVWFYYGLFLGARWVYRNNVLGQTITSVTRRRQQPAPYDPHGAPARPVDLATYGDWDGPMRTRS
jgi:hypothetical protein